MANSSKVIEIFYCYASEDIALQNELEKHLIILKRQGLISTWHSQEILTGTPERQEIDRHLNTADIILILISPDFIASDYCYKVEMEHALRRHNAGNVWIIPILLRFADWEHTPLGKLQFLPKDKKPLASWSNRHRRDKAFLEISFSIREVIEAMKKRENIKRTTQPGLLPSLAIYVAQVHTARASFYYQQRKYEEALEIYKHSLALDPHNAITYSGMADVLNELSRYEEAIANYEKAIFLDPEDIINYISKGHALYNVNQFQEALKAYTQAIQLDPENVEAWLSMGNALWRLGREEQALESYSKVIQLDPEHAAAWLGPRDNSKQAKKGREPLLREKRGREEGDE
jgi:tetratricopeptide (TPR) repeat protein